MTTPEQIAKGCCATCQWWNPDSPATSKFVRFENGAQVFMRDCQRHSQFNPHWPDDWCGEYAVREVLKGEG